MAILEARNLAKSYGKRPVVKDVSLSVKQGEIVGLLGPNGAGKTTCFYMIIGLVAQDGGAVTVDGQDITALPMHGRARRGLGYLPQEPQSSESSVWRTIFSLFWRLTLNSAAGSDVGDWKICSMSFIFPIWPKIPA